MNVEQHAGESTEQYIERLRSTVRALKDTETSETMMRRYLEDSLTLLRANGAPLAARIEHQRLIALCCHRIGVARGQQDILTARIVTALAR